MRKRSNHHLPVSGSPTGLRFPPGFPFDLHPLRWIIPTILFLVLGAAELSAQTVAIGGSVRDRQTQAGVAGARVIFLDEEGGVLDSVLTDAQGEWNLQVTGVQTSNDVSLPQSFELGANFPNPFNPSTRIPFRLGHSSHVRLTIHNLLGQQLDVREAFLPAGSYTVDWRSEGSTGVLFYTLEVNGIAQTRRMIQLDRGSGGGLTDFHSQLSFTLRKTSAGMAAQTLTLITSSLLYEPDTSSLVAVAGAHADIQLDKVHGRATVIDLHNDVLEQIVASGFTYQIDVRNATHHTDLPRLRDGGVDAQSFSVWVDSNDPPYYQHAITYLDSLKAQVARSPDEITLTTTADSIGIINGEGRIAGFLLLEGGHSIEDNLDNLREFYARGVRIMTITWNNSTSWAVAAAAPNSSTVGLSDFGRDVIRTMDSLGMIIDVSHTGIKTIEDILSVTTHPIIASHSGSYALRSHYRNLTDDQIRAIAQTGGVIGVVFYPPFLVSAGPTSVDNVIQHIDHIRNLVGIDHVALGSDFDGFSSSPPVGLEDVSRFPAITEALLRRGYSREDVHKVLGENFLRVFREVCH